jgi:hypothetical protein
MKVVIVAELVAGMISPDGAAKGSQCELTKSVNKAHPDSHD